MTDGEVGVPGGRVGADATALAGRSASSLWGVCSEQALSSEPVLGEERELSDERLRRLEALTDPVLVHLDTSELLDELVGRVERLLNVDTVAVLLLDPTGSELIAR